MSLSAPKMNRIAIVAGEDSGDILGADLIASLQKRFPDVVFEGIGGKRMIMQGFNSLYPLERLSVMGFIEPLKRLPELISIHYNLKKYFTQNKPLAFIGIDAPDFNLPLEKALKMQGIKTVHYVSPTIWAWRPKRIHKIKKAIDHMLAVFPFEMKIYHEHQVPITCVGHSLADQIAMNNEQSQARAYLNLDPAAKIVALLPGSRCQELNYLAPEFIKTAQWLIERDPNIQFISASSNEAREQQFQSYIEKLNGPAIKIFNRQSKAVMAAADVILTASGTASLEAMLIKRPTLVAYKMSALTFAIAKRLVKVPYIALPNLLAGKCIMPEFIQSDVQAEKMGKVILAYLQSPESIQALLPIFQEIHHSLRRNAGESAAQAIEQLILENSPKVVGENEGNSSEANRRRG